MNDLGSRVILGITHDDDATSTCFDFAALGDCLRRVVGTFGMKVWTNFSNNGAYVRFRKDHNGVNVGQRCQNFRALVGWHDGPPFALQRAHGSVGVDSDDQFAAEFPRGAEVAYMADVQQIETSVSQRDAIAGAAPIRHTLLQFIARKNLLME